MKREFLVVGIVLAVCVTKAMATSDFDRMVQVKKGGKTVAADISIKDISESGLPEQDFNFSYSGTGFLDIYLRYDPSIRPVGTYDSIQMMVSIPSCKKTLKFHHLPVMYAWDPANLEINMDQCFTPGDRPGVSDGNQGSPGAPGVSNP